MLKRHTNPELQAHYDRNADATGHAEDCRRRVVPTLVSDGRALDPARCERCQYLAWRLQEAAKRHSSYPGWV